jgi:hypothetical protein
MSKPKFVYVTFIRATPEKVWEALTKADLTEKYWFGYRVSADGSAVAGRPCCRASRASWKPDRALNRPGSRRRSLGSNEFCCVRRQGRPVCRAGRS